MMSALTTLTSAWVASAPFARSRLFTFIPPRITRSQRAKTLAALWLVAATLGLAAPAHAQMRIE